MKRKRLLIVLGSALIVLLLMGVAQAQWLDPAWKFRTPVTISNSSGVDLTDFQVQVNLDSSIVSKALSDGNDLRVTDTDGVTKIPFWIEAWTPPTASIWVKVPSISAGGDTIFLYYGNPTSPGPALVEVPPIGPWTEPTVPPSTAVNPIRPIGDPDANPGRALLAENIVYDDATNKYWLIFANYRNSSVGLVWCDGSQDPGDPGNWHWHGSVISSANAPHLIKHNGTWYIFYADKARTAGSVPGYSGAYPSSNPISVASSTDVGGPYVYVGTVLTSTEPWEAYRVDEPYVFQRNDGKWILVYMGDAGSTTEIIGYAVADNILGPYTKFSGNPIINFGPAGSIDAGTVADPWVVEFKGTYYIGYTVSPTKSSPWKTAYVTTTDWVNFTKHGIIRDLGPSGSWDQLNAFRGAVTRFEDTYYFSYTGKPAGGPLASQYVMGIVTQPAFMPEKLNSCEEVFEFCDTFDGDALDTSKWFRQDTGTGHTVDVSGGFLTITARANGYVQMRGNKIIGTGTLLEAYASHPDAGLIAGPLETNTAAEIGYKPSDFSFSSLIRVMDFPDMQKYTIQASAGANTSGYVDTAVDFDDDWHTYRIYRTEGGTVEFQIDSNTPESLGAPNVPTIGLYPWLMDYARPPVPRSQMDVDWIRVRKWYGEDLPAVIGSRESNVRGDLNGDGCVAMADYNLLIAYIRALGPYNPAYDINGDGKVNIADARYLVTLFTNPRGTPCN